MEDLFGDQFGVIDVAIKHLAAKKKFDLRAHHRVRNDDAFRLLVGFVNGVAQ